AFARVLLRGPNIIVMDEATSALDPRSQDLLMGLLLQQLEQATIISVGHRPELEHYHDRKIVLEGSGGSARIVSDIPIAPQPPSADRFPRGLTRKVMATTAHKIMVNLERHGAAAAQSRPRHLMPGGRHGTGTGLARI